MQETNTIQPKIHKQKKSLKQHLFGMLMVMLCANTTNAFTPEADKHYSIFNEPVKSELIMPKGVIKFFSFACPNCYAFEYQYEIPKKINQLIAPSEVQYVNVDTAIGAGDLTQAWAFTEIASRLFARPDAKETVKSALYEGLRNNAIQNSEDVKEILLSVFKITEDAFFALWDSDPVITLSNEQTVLTRKFKIKSTPTMLINGKYLVSNSDFKDAGNTETFMDWYLTTIKYLFDKKD